MNARRYATLIVLGWMVLAPAPAGAEDPSPPAPLPPRPPDAPRSPKPEESERLAVKRRMADLMARFEKAKEAGREQEMAALANELASLKASLEAQKIAKYMAGSQSEQKRASDEAAILESRLQAVRAQRNFLEAALLDAQVRGSEKEVEALTAQMKQVEAQVQELKRVRLGEVRIVDISRGKDWPKGMRAEGQPAQDDPAQMQQRLMRLQQAIRLLMEAGLPERANAVEQDAQRLKAAIAARASASSPEGDLVREIRSLREEVQQMRRELGELRAILQRDK